MTRMSTLIIEVRPGERLALSGAATVELMHKSGQLARLRVSAPPHVAIEKHHRARDDKPVPSMQFCEPS